MSRRENVTESFGSSSGAQRLLYNPTVLTRSCWRPCSPDEGSLMSVISHCGVWLEWKPAGGFSLQAPSIWPWSFCQSGSDGQSPRGYKGQWQQRSGSDLENTSIVNLTVTSEKEKAIIQLISHQFWVLSKWELSQGHNGHNYTDLLCGDLLQWPKFRFKLAYHKEWVH